MTSYQEIGLVRQVSNQEREGHIMRSKAQLSVSKKALGFPLL